jgi:hypothetical protein
MAGQSPEGTPLSILSLATAIDSPISCAITTPDHQWVWEG